MDQVNHSGRPLQTVQTHCVHKCAARAFQNASNAAASSQSTTSSAMLKFVFGKFANIQVYFISICFSLPFNLFVTQLWPTRTDGRRR